MKEVSPQDHEFLYWYRQPENKQAVGRAWLKQWERDHWAEDVFEPEQPLTPEEQAKVDAYYPQIFDTLEGRTGDLKDEDEAIRERALSDWYGIREFKSLYNGTSGEDRTAIIRAIATVIKRTEQHPNLSAGLIYGVAHLELTEVELTAAVEPSIKKLSRTPLATENDALRDAIGKYKAFRISDIPPEWAAQIYQSLRNTPSQASQQ